MVLRARDHRIARRLQHGIILDSPCNVLARCCSRPIADLEGNVGVLSQCMRLVLCEDDRGALPYREIIIQVLTLRGCRSLLLEALRALRPVGSLRPRRGRRRRAKRDAARGDRAGARRGRVRARRQCGGSRSGDRARVGPRRVGVLIQGRQFPNGCVRGGCGHVGLARILGKLWRQHGGGGTTRSRRAGLRGFLRRGGDADGGASGGQGHAEGCGLALRLLRGLLDFLLLGGVLGAAPVQGCDLRGRVGDDPLPHDGLARLLHQGLALRGAPDWLRGLLRRRRPMRVGGVLLGHDICDRHARGLSGRLAEGSCCLRDWRLVVGSGHAA
mmetsp:Transcript_8113/g.21255  ORF Transcript_8113/g.21255 Transcript_8113/m.21255 type:complete len:328 (+) Transcript_8113:2361-3344(+)